MPSIWTRIKSLAFWKKRQWKAVSADTKDTQRIRNYKRDSRRETIKKKTKS